MRGVQVLLAWGLLLALPAVVAAQSASDQVPVPQPGGPLVRAGMGQSVVEIARANAAQRAGVTLDQVSVVSVQPTEWPDLSLGCTSTNPPLAFAEVVIPGFIVELTVSGTPTIYHTDAGVRAVPCDAPASPPPDAAN